MTVKKSSSTRFCRGQLLGTGGVSVHLSVRRWYCVKTNSRRIIQFSPADRTETVVFSSNFHTLHVCTRS